jgi:hypothetical protein
MTELGFTSNPASTERGRFQLSVAQVSPAGFVLRAVRVDPNADDECQWFSIDQSQLRQSGPQGAERCWFR